MSVWLIIYLVGCFISVLFAGFMSIISDAIPRTGTDIIQVIGVVFLWPITLCYLIYALYKAWKE